MSKNGVAQSESPSCILRAVWEFVFPPVMPTEIFYSKAGEFSRPDADVANKLLVPQLRETVEAFIANIERVHAFWMFHPRLVDDTALNISLMCEAAFSETGHWPLTISEKFDVALKARIEEKVRAIVKERYGETPLSARNTVAVKHFDDLAKKLPHWTESLQAALKSQLLGIWTAYEILASDLWITTLNLRPDLVTRWKPENKNDEKSIPLWRLNQWGFDLRHCMGKVLKELGKADFSSQNTTEKAYRKIFGEHGENLFANQQLGLLEAVRNLLAHRAGKIDSGFINAMKGLSHPFGQLEIDTELEFTGEITRDLSSAAVNQGIKLIRFVDGWLTNVAETIPSTL